MSRGSSGIGRLAVELAAAPRLRQALTVVILGVALAPDAVRTTLGLPGWIAVIGSLLVIAVLSIIGQGEEIQWSGVLPISLLALLGWISLSVVWSEYTWASIGGVAAALAMALLALYIALSRDLIQIVRAAGDALRAILVVSIVLEAMSGLIFDVPFTFIGIAGNLAQGGPITGISGTRNELCFLAGLGVLTFWIEWRTRSVRRGVSVGSLSLALGTILLARSPVTVLVLLGIGVLGLALVALRRTTPERRTIAQPVLLAAALIAGAVVWLLRSRVIDLFNASSDLETRLERWAQLRALIDVHAVEGWGWVGVWPVELFPFSTIRSHDGGQAGAALNALYDAWFQIGLVGTALLVIALGLGFVRAWLVASEFRSTVHVWPALTLALLAATSLAESFVLSDGGLLLAVLACVTAARKRSWRQRLG
ncbi:exopolysaccharide production protein [Homoserinibacter sp. YIM 151385]|uniref:exopolysaccharide production protein n=1 Tax=Homoserinibacter sp. YIM 151385 TaxID=2985506 RepID=UPI0022F02441|nr:exopolysaccharide production protein [Homoserinibacter sp. YIM 151385]WBU37787.1 exopolysaccharide production protein [Homoserinibacter sp. YIM 151385]